MLDMVLGVCVYTFVINGCAIEVNIVVIPIDRLGVHI